MNKRRRIILSALLVVVFALMALVATTVSAAEYEVCNPNPWDDLNGAITSWVLGGTATAYVTNTSDACTYDQVGFAAYEKFDNVIDNQVLFSSAVSGPIAPGETIEFEIRLPECAAQLDLFWGELLPSLDGYRYGGRKIDFEHIGGDDFCIPQEPTEADLELIKDAPGSALVGEQFDYVITVNNLGDVDAENAVVTDTLPALVAFVSSAECVEAPVGTVTCSLGTIAAGGTASATITVQALDVGVATNVATVTTTTPESNLDNNTDDAVTTISDQSTELFTLSILKFEDVDLNQQWGNEPVVANFTFTVTGSGNVVVGTPVTGLDGIATIQLPAGDYSVSEAVDACWTPTTPNPQAVTLGPDTTLYFGNILNCEQQVGPDKNGPATVVALQPNDQDPQGLYEYTVDIPNTGDLDLQIDFSDAVPAEFPVDSAYVVYPPNFTVIACPVDVPTNTVTCPTFPLRARVGNEQATVHILFSNNAANPGNITNTAYITLAGTQLPPFAASHTIEVLSAPPVSVSFQKSYDGETLPLDGWQICLSTDGSEPLTDGCLMTGATGASIGTLSVVPGLYYVLEPTLPAGPQACDGNWVMVSPVGQVNITQSGAISVVNQCQLANPVALPVVQAAPPAEDQPVEQPVEEQPPAPTVCNPGDAGYDPRGDLRVAGGGWIHDEGDTAWADVVNESATCAYYVNMAAYMVFDGSVETQQLFSSFAGDPGVVVGPGETITLRVPLPECQAQVDVFYGPIIPSFADGSRYSWPENRLLSALHTDRPYCEPTEPPPPADDDGDGVPNDADQCPDTPSGTAVDTVGCPVDVPPPADDDGDGVPNVSDVCPGFDDNVDTDGDTIPDGCDTDDDNDGVPNESDVCPGFDDNVDTDGDGTPDGCDIDEVVEVPVNIANITASCNYSVTITDSNEQIVYGPQSIGPGGQLDLTLPPGTYTINATSDNGCDPVSGDFTIDETTTQVDLTIDEAAG